MSNFHYFELTLWCDFIDIDKKKLTLYDEENLQGKNGTDIFNFPLEIK